MKPTEIDPDFMICPKCGADTYRDDGKWSAGTADTRRRQPR